MKTILSITLALGLGASLTAAAAAPTAPDTPLFGRVYPIATGSTPVFIAERSTKTTGEKSVLTERYKDMDGNTAALLESTYVAGSLRSINFEQNQSKQSAAAVFKDGRVFFTRTENGTARTSDQAVTGQWVALSAVPDAIVKNWDAVTGGQPFEFTMPVPIMRDHFGFSIVKQRTWTENGKQLTEFKMQPSSMMIRMMADTIYYVFDDESRTLVEYRGLIIAKTGDNGNLKDLNAKIIYSPAAMTSLAGQ